MKLYLEESKEALGQAAAALIADKLCQATLAITAPPEVRVRRIMAREGIPEDYARAQELFRGLDR